MRLPQTRREKEIWQACDELWSAYKDSKRLTGDAIRDRLLELDYKKGSPNEIYRYRKSWQENTGLLATVTTTSEPEAALSDPLNRAVSLVREEIFTEAKQTIEKITLAFEEERIEFERERQLAKTSTDALAEELEAVNSKIQLLEAQCLEYKAQEVEYLNTVVLLNEKIQGVQGALEHEQHDKALCLERFRQFEAQHEQLMQEADKKLALVQTTAQHDYQALLENLEKRHIAQAAQYQEEQKGLRDLMESQRHQWVALLDAAKTENQKLLAQNQKLDKAFEQQQILRQQFEERMEQYEALLELQDLQASLLRTVSEDVKNLEKGYALDKLQLLLEEQTQLVSKHLQSYIQAQFQQQNELLLHYVKEQPLVSVSDES